MLLLVDAYQGSDYMSIVSAERIVSVSIPSGALVPVTAHKERFVELTETGLLQFHSAPLQTSFEVQMASKQWRKILH